METVCSVTLVQYVHKLTTTITNRLLTAPPAWLACEHVASARGRGGGGLEVDGGAWLVDGAWLAEGVCSVGGGWL